jgi:hypothetical protein
MYITVPRRTAPEQPFRPGCQRSRQPDLLPDMKLLGHYPSALSEITPSATQP